MEDDLRAVGELEGRLVVELEGELFGGERGDRLGGESEIQRVQVDEG